MVAEGMTEKMSDLLARETSAGPASDAAIAAAEAALGIVFPPSYRHFLRQWGASTAGRYEVSGIDDSPLRPDDTPRWPSVVENTLRQRRASRGLIPSHLVSISGDGQDHHFFLDTAESDSPGEFPVRVLGPGRDGDVVARSFVEFLELAVGDQLDHAY